MPTVHSVNDITKKLSDIIQSESTLQNVWVTGEVANGRPDVFFLKHKGRSLRCFIPGGDTAQFGSLLKTGNTVAVNGNIQIFAACSEYQICVANVQSLAVDRLGNNQLFTVSDITDILAQIIAGASELTEIQLRGEISELSQQSEAIFWFLRDKDNEVISGSQQIHCVSFFDQGRILMNNGEEIWIQGAIKILSAYSRYQINVAKIKSLFDDNEEQCQCPGCDRCGSALHCNRRRKIANFESCTTCLPHPPDELYELCPECYGDSPDHETKVAEKVYAYFDKLGVNGLLPKKESIIQFGTRNGNADVVLADGDGSFAAIAECKGAGYVGHGIEQLKSYLSATDTRFGIFANRTDPERWTFYENRRRNQIEPIDRSEFEMLIADQETSPLHEQPNPNPTPLPIPSNQAPRLWQYITGVLGVALCICLTVLIMQLDEKNRQIQDDTRTISQLQNENKTLESENKNLQEQIRNSPQTISQLQNENKTLISENQLLQTQIAEKDKQIQNYTSTVLKLESENKTLESKNQSLQKQITENEKEIESLVTKNKELERKIEECESRRNGSHPPKPPSPDNPPILLNINTASIEKLQTLPDIGPAKAQSIFNYREKHGKFDSVEDITKVSGIGEKTLEKLRGFISVE